ncbi:MAG TPA: response regulator [Candidatus Bathyarchaeia archaeon]|nr:response regulator [Candidatus Bathyarchaeia archaeon]
MAAATRNRILLVDDESTILLTLSTILRQEGYTVSTAATVAEALREIGSHTFDALIADLNIGEPGDGFTVVSAMRRTQPECINLILTGYPAFESALQAIRNQVDDYLVKPADVRALVKSLEAKLSNPRQAGSMTMQSLAEFLRENAEEISRLALAGMKADSRLGAIPLDDKQRLDHLPDLLSAIVEQLRSRSPLQAARSLLEKGARHGATRRKQRYTEDMLVDDIRVVDMSIYDTVQSGLLKLDLSGLIPDLRNVNVTLSTYLQESIRAFQNESVN